MARIIVETSGDPAGDLRALVAARRAGARKALAKSAHLVERNAKLKLSLSSHVRGTPTPSKPGEPPSLVSGTLRRSVKVRGPHPIPQGWEATVAPTAVYGRIQELGGWAGRGLRTHLPARPYMRPAAAESLPGIKQIFGQEWAVR